MKYLTIRIEIQIGEYMKYDTTILHTTNANNLDFAVNRFVSKFWGRPSDRDGDVWYFYNGEVASKLISYEEVTEEEYNFLQKYI
jgi:hypothetical protein